MAAAPGTPLLVPPRNPGYLATATAGWSSLPDDLVRRIADSFLPTNDVDCYMCCRSVCHSWRAATDDPRSHASDPRFMPLLWIVLDEAAQGKLLLLNTRTGRFLHKKLPPHLLRECYVVAAAPSGFFVLADASPPHAARLFNPLTGVLTRLTAAVPPEARVADIGRNSDDSLSILLLDDSSRKIYTTCPDSEGFVAEDNSSEGVYNFLRNAVVGGASAHISGPALVDVVSGFFDYLQSLHIDHVTVFSSDYTRVADDVHCFLVGVDAHMVLVMKTFGSIFVFKVDTKIGNIEPVQTIRRFAIFIGYCRCLSVDATKFSGIEANCVYYTEHLGLLARICKYSLKDKETERISEAAEFVKQDKQFALVADRPFTVIQLLCSYTINIPDSQLALQPTS